MKEIQRDNLFEKTHRGNQENQHVTKTSQYLGVSRHKATGKWRAQIRVAGKSCDFLFCRLN